MANEFVVKRAESARREAGAYLAVGGNRMRLITAELICLLTVMLYVLLYNAYDAARVALLPTDHSAYAVDIALATGFDLTVLAVTLFVTVPLLCGLLRIAERITVEREVTLTELFHSFSSKHAYARAVRLSCRCLWKLAVAAVAVRWIYGLARMQTGDAYAAFGAVLAVVCISFLALLWSADGFYTAYFAYRNEDVSVRAAYRCSQQLSRNCRAAAWHFVLEYLLWLVLSVLTAGILLLADVLPRILVSYFRFSEQIERAEATETRLYQSEDIKDHE
ncbi:MAG: hypothetical protein IJW16_07405 [Clostridia bacterium]|nr:hypothetical protein [Clostridia bacterium]